MALLDGLALMVLLGCCFPLLVLTSTWTPTAWCAWFQAIIDPQNRLKQTSVSCIAFHTLSSLPLYPILRAISPTASIFLNAKPA